ncbi:AAL014Cp [Eremothecium gossypii ATCC 10895]|uniref:Putative mitochondrial carrier protein PET8 n=1 Tax=Eremothecium gossypii (strain ATCC 10895 / CBS 109.51 / FGSC 9923 / NRRL Y-1056) TaxID=284811 RepID=PET8_EREGS|nr:AAL014Cp [Eremothecium gossypii ATCC 10895]O60029.1 RecName: Full=Putative mitochondrial carrier protein PET8 [Eremothecium gossypii ATCC 10895]AAS50352.1 AAL014Cp [Eremothecium gossypii ATCC 10895]AEY94638.1 FAAL014Cp [Eremothecium gossypii FDAG1]CAA07008.1 AgPET8 [Eremothecium gossypii]
MDSTFLASLVSGAAAGTSTDVVFFPIDTLKTRLQAKGGFFHNGGYRGIYRGLGSAVVASAPGASLFFVTYDSMKQQLRPVMGRWTASEQLAEVLTHMLSSSLGEMSACLVRVPAEVIKQRTQTHHTNSSLQTLRLILRDPTGEGVVRGLYRGWWTTIMREIPFTCIQFPLYEYLKKKWAAYAEIERVSAWQGAVCGSLAGGIAAAATTPLDVLKTRMMLHERRVPMLHLARTLFREEGARVFFRGIGPRTMWISAGGAIFLGVYEAVHSLF